MSAQDRGRHRCAHSCPGCLCNDERGKRRNTQDGNEHICACSRPEHSHEIEGKGKGAHRTGAGTDVLAHVLSIHILTARRMSCVTYRMSHRPTVASTSIRQSPTSMEVGDCQVPALD